MNSGKVWLTACAAFVVGLILRSEYEKEQLSIEHTTIWTDKIAKDCTIVFLSDLHDHEFGYENSRLLSAIDEVNPDIVLLGGDMMVCKGTADLKISIALIEALVKRYPVYAGNGNHETRMNRERETYGRQYDIYVNQLKDLGVIVLENKTELFRSDIIITGIDLEERFYAKFHLQELTSADIEAKAGKSNSAKFHILLCHSPLYFSACRNWGADLTLSGHFHGGTIRLPILGGVMTPQFQFFLPWCAGTFEEKGKYMVVSRGLGTHSINVRINDKPQLVVVDLKKKTTF